MVPFLDLQAQYKSIKQEVDEAIAGVLESSEFVLGRAVQAFEANFANYCQTRHAVGVNSGTSALHLALLAAGVGPGDEVITVPMTFLATVAAIDYAGAKPVFVDVHEDSWNMDVSQVEQAITPRTKAIMPVHLHGMMADMDAIMAIAERHSLTVIEDAAQAHGAEYHGRRAGSIGHFGCFSFYPGKNIGAYGEGGAVVCAHDDHAEKLRMLRNWGEESRYHHVLKGFNYRMDGIQGAVLGVKLRHIENWTEMRRGHAKLYDDLLSEREGIGTPLSPSESRHVYHVYAVRLASRDAVRERLSAAGIASGIHYPVPVHLQPAYEGLGYRAGDFPVSEQLAREFLSLPMYPELSDRLIIATCQALTDAMAAKASGGTL